MSEYDYDNDARHQEALDRITARLLKDRVARRRSASHAHNTRKGMGHAPEGAANPPAPMDALADSYLRTEALARVFRGEDASESESEDYEPLVEHTLAGTRRVHTDAIKGAALALHAQGVSYAEIARRVHADPGCVRKWCTQEPVEPAPLAPEEPEPPAPPAPEEPAQVPEQVAAQVAAQVAPEVAPEVAPQVAPEVAPPRRRYEEASPETRAYAASLHAQGIRYAEIARMIGTDQANVRNWCLRASAPPRPPKIRRDKDNAPVPRNTPHPPETRARAIELRKQGLSLAAISTATGVATGTLHDWCKAAGLPRFVVGITPPQVPEPEPEPAPPAQVPAPQVPAPALQQLQEIVARLQVLEAERAQLRAQLLALRATLAAQLAQVDAALVL